MEIIDGFPSVIVGELIFCNKDNMNTDLIYAGKYTYADNFTSEDQAKVVMENYDPEFKNKIKENDILLSGYNFGSGSSREQAATSLKYAGIKIVIGGSFSQTYLRNAINNGFLCLAIPELLEYFRKKYTSDEPTIKTNQIVTIDFQKSKLMINQQQYRFTPVGKAAQEIIANGGLENFVRNEVNQN